MKKKIVLISLLVIVIGLIAVCFTVVEPGKKQKIEDKSKENIEEIITSFLDETKTEKELEKLTGLEDVSSLIIVGEDSEFQKKPSDDLIEQYNLQDYVKKQKVYAEKIENSFIKNFSYEIANKRNENGTVFHEIKITGYYYENLMVDITELAMKILETSGYDFSKVESDTNTQVAFYKAKVKALEIISPFTEKYENHEETITFDVIYKDNKPYPIDEISNLVSNMRGAAYKSMDYTDPTNLENIKNRVNNYFETAKNDGTLDLNNPFNLK